MPASKDLIKRPALKGYFEAGDIPEAYQFAELIDLGVIQGEDGIRKNWNNPLDIQVEQVATADPFKKEAIRFYSNIEATPDWRISLVNAPVAGLSVSDQENTNVNGIRTSSSRLFIATTGNAGIVGIGTETPGAELDVMGSIRLNNAVPNGAQKIEFLNAARNDKPKIEFAPDLGLGLNAEGLFYNADKKHAWRDALGIVRMQLDTASAGGLSVAGTGNSFIAGNLGIGKQPNPGARLDVGGDIHVSGQIRIPGAQKIEFSNGDVSNNLKIQLWTGYGLGINDSTLFYTANGNHSWRDASGAERMRLNTAGNGGLSVTGTGNSSFSGKLGIGKPNPAAKLDVDGDIRLSKNLTVGTGDSTFGGKVGINISGTPKATLDVGGAGNDGVELYVNGRIRSAGSNGGLWVDGTSVNKKFVGAEGDKIGFYNGAWRLVIDANGRVDIGGHLKAGSLEGNGAALTNLNANNMATGTLHKDRLPDSVDITHINSTRLTLNGDLYLNEDKSIYVNYGTYALINRQFIKFERQLATDPHRGRVSIWAPSNYYHPDATVFLMGGYGGQGHVGIRTPNPDAVLSVSGDASKTGGGDWKTFSDRRVKKDIESFTDGLDLVSRIRPVRYRFNGAAGYPDDGKTYIGVIGQDMQQIAPYMIEPVRKKLHENDPETTDLLMFDGSALVYLLINAVQEQQKQIEKQQSEIEAIHALLNSNAVGMEA